MAANNPSSKEGDHKENLGSGLSDVPAADDVAVDRNWIHPLENGDPPPWADEWGQDREYGPWCTIRAGSRVQRMRWVPPGGFWMGRLQDEARRHVAEQRRWTVIPDGFWIFDTPCTQAFWYAVTGRYPSYFQQEQGDGPVESVNWNECRSFIQTLNEKFEGLKLGLPSEAQWEYACYAGVSSDWYAPDLDAIAWYSSNSRRSTRRVGKKRPNAWGLYDMLGNVWEWCEDVWTPNPGITPAPGAASRSNRVLRGGSWRDSERRVCAGERFHHNPSGRYSYIGFRCAEYREGEVRPAEVPRQA